MALGAFKKLAKKTPVKAKKNAHPEFEDDSLSPNIDAFYQAKKNEKTAKAQARKAEQLILEKATARRGDWCASQGRYESSVKMEAGGKKVTVKFPNRYSKIPTDEMDSLAEIYGDDASRYFKEKTVVELTNEALNDEEFVNGVMEAIGEEKFGRYFNVSEHLEVAKAYHEDRVTNPKLAEKHQEAVDQGLVKPTKPSVTLG
jgi:hypothetical protein